MKMRLELLRSLVLVALLAPGTAHAFRLLAGGGLGSSSSSRDATYTESPLMQNYAADFERDSHNVFGVEHIRSLGMSPLSTAIAYSGLTYRFYFTGTPTPFTDLGGIRTNSVEFRDWCLFTGFSFGIAQSSAPDLEGASRSAAGVYVSPKGGIDLALGPSWGVRGELMVLMSVFGAGQISSMGLGGGFFFVF